MAAYEVITLNEAAPQLRAPGTGNTYSMPRATAITGETLTGSAATTTLDLTQTWNTTGTPTAIKLNVTNTASNAASLLMDLQVGGASVFSVDVTSDNNNGIVLGPRDATGVLMCRPSNGVLAVKLGDTSSYGHIYCDIVGFGAGTGYLTGSSGVAMRLSADGGTTGLPLELYEQTAPVAGGANSVRIYAQDNGAGKTQLMALFSSGAAQQLAIQP